MIGLVQDGASNMEIVEKVPSMAMRIPAIEQYRQAYWEEQGKEYRNMTVWYIFGKPELGRPPMYIKPMIDRKYIQLLTIREQGYGINMILHVPEYYCLMSIEVTCHFRYCWHYVMDNH